MRVLWAAVLGIALSAGCSSPSPTPSTATPASMEATTEKGLAIPVEQLAVPYCPECEMSFRRFAIQDTLTYEGKLYGFCSSACKESFAQRMGSR